jgi:hypothetical protein
MRRLAIAFLVALAGLTSSAWGQPAPRPLVGMGDSIGAGVQSGDTSVVTQRASYLHLIAKQLGVPFRLPWVASGAAGTVDQMAGRRRLFPYRAPDNLAVSGADTLDVLQTLANATTPSGIDSETDLMLFPYQGSQLDIVEAVHPELVVCWIGNNDVLGAVLAYDQLDASQMTSVSDFQDRFGELATRLGALGKPVVFANLPDVTDIAYLVDRDDLVRLTGSSFGLPAGSYTSLVEVVLLLLGLDNGGLLQNPDFVLDAAEVAQISARVSAFNAIIAAEAGAIGMPVVDVHALFAQFSAAPPVVAGVTLTPRFLGGLFSLDGVHPSDFAHAVLANAFIQRINAHFGVSIPYLGEEALIEILLTDPFIDKDADGVVTGRRLASALETLAELLGVSGDLNDLDASIRGAAAVSALSSSARLESSLRVLGEESGSAPTREELLRGLDRALRPEKR